MHSQHPEIAKKWDMEENKMEHGKHMMPGMPPKEMKDKDMGKKEARMKAVKKALKKKK